MDSKMMKVKLSGSLLFALLFSEAFSESFALNIEDGTVTGFTGDCPAILEIPAGVTSIGDIAFAWQSSLVSVTLPSSITKVGDFAFEHCDSLSNVVFKGSRDKIRFGQHVFRETPYNASLPFTPLVYDGVFEGFFGVCPGQVTIPNGVVEIASMAMDSSSYWLYVDDLRKVTIPKSVRKIGSYAFWGCPNLSEVVYLGDMSKIAFGTEVFANTPYNRSRPFGLTVDAAGTVIGFEGCAPSVLEIPEGIRSVGEFAFGGNNDLLDEVREIRIAGTVTNIGAFAFLMRDHVTNLVFAARTNLPEMSEDSFKWCDALSMVDLSKVVVDDRGQADFWRKWIFGSDAALHVKGIETIVAMISWPGYEDLGFMPIIRAPDWHAPENLTAENGLSIDLRWDSVAAADSYEILRSEYNDISWAESVGTVTETTFQDDSVGGYWPYYYWVRPLYRGYRGDCSDSVMGVRVNAATEFHWDGVASDEMWLSGGEHLIVDEIRVVRGVCLTIAPGAVVKFADGASLIVEDGGSCIARGVIFTHVNDDTVGEDTLMDGDATKPEVCAYEVIGNVLDDETTEYRYQAPEVMSGTISSNTRLRGWKVYHVTGHLTVASGVTLTIEPGCVVKFDAGCRLSVDDGATFDAQGTRALPITFTSVKDDACGGDTNGDGDKTYPYAGDWSRIECGGTVKMNHCRIWYASDASDRGAIQGAGGTVRFDNGEIAHMVYECVRMNSGSFVSYNSVFRDSSMGFGYYGGSGTYAYNCVIADCSSGCRASNKHFYNTVFYRCADAFLESTASSCDHCMFYNPSGYGPQSATQVGSNGNIWGDPMFLDPDNGDFRVSRRSLAIDTGDASAAPELDYYGQPRNGAPDIGIFEYQGSDALSPNDLVAVGVSAAETVTVGEPLNVKWRIANRGVKPVAGSWRDRVSLTDGAGEYVLGTVISRGTLPVGATNELSGTFAVPAELEGTWHVRVHVNAERDIYEGTVNVTNNTVTSERTTTVSVRAEPIEGGFSGKVPAGGSASAKFAVSGGEPMIGRIVAPVGTIVYFGNGFAPTAANYSAKTRVDANGGVIGIPVGVATAYFTVTTESGAAADFSIAFESGALAVKGVSPVRVPFSGTTGLIVTGANFDENCSVELTVDGNPGAAYVPEKVSLVSATQLSLTVDCSKLQAGKGYAVTVTSADGAKATCAGAFTVEAIPPKAELKATLDVPSAVRQGRTVTCWIDYENTGNVDMPVPVFEIVSEGQIFKVDGNVHSNSVKVMGLAAEAPHGTLRPGDPQRLGVQVTCMAANVKWKLKSYHAAQEGAKTAALSLRELYADDWVLYHGAEDDPLLARLRQKVGSTRAEYYEKLGDWMSANNVTVLDYVKVRDAFAQMQYAAVAGAFVDRAASAARKMSVKLMSPQCNHVRLASHWKDAGNGSMFRLCPNCKNFYQVMEHPSAGVYTRLEDDGFDSEGKDVYVICHGNANSVAEGWILDMGKALLSRNQADGVEAEVLAVNWGEGAMTLGAQPYTSAGRIPEVANEAQGELVALGIRPEQTTLIGHSHGGHVAANIACHYGLKGKFKRYVGLDTSTTDNLVHSLWKLWGYIVPSANSALWYGNWTPDCWMKDIAKYVEDGGVEFYKSTFNMSLEEANQLFGDWNFALFVSGDFWEEGAVGLGPKADNGFIGATSRELSRHSWAYQWYTETIKNKGGFPDLGYNFEGGKSWKRLHNGFEVPRPPEKHYAGMICGNVLELAPRESNRRMWNYETLVIDGQDASTLPKSLFRLQECLFYARDYSVSAQIESGVDVKQLDGLPSGTTITVSVKNNANDYSIRYKQFLSGKKDRDDMDNSGGGRVTVWLVDAESLGLSSQPYDIHDLSVRLWDDANEYVREIGTNSKWWSGCQFDDSSVFALPGDESPKTAKIPISFSNEIFGPDRPLLRTDESGKVVMRNVLLVIGAGCNYPEWERDLSHKNYDLDPTDNYIIKKLVAVPQDTWAVISRRPAKANALKAMSFSASYMSASAFAPQLSENALKPGEVIPVTAAKDGTWSIDLDGSESFSLTDDTLDVLSFTLPEYGATKGTVTLNGKGARYDMPWTTVSGQLPSGVDADGNPICEGERYTVKLTVYTQEGDEASVSCVLDVRYAMDEDEGEDEDATTSTSPKSCDPNEMAGPEGVGAERFVKPGEWMTYTIYFENKADAEAAAAQVTVTNPLSDCLDWDSFEMIEVGFGNQVDSALDGASSGSHEVTMDGTNLQVRTEFEVRDGVAEWYLRIVDPDGDDDGWPFDMYAGFLPPNDPETHCGEGHLTYRVKVREDAPRGARIDNSATIVFDYNDPIGTDPAWWNTVGADLETWPEDGDFSAKAANVYDGFLADESGNVVGTVQVKTAKQDKKGKVTATATVTANGKKWSYTGGKVSAAGAVTGLKCTTKGCPAKTFGVTLGRNGLEGEWGSYAVFGARQVKPSAAYVKNWTVAFANGDWVQLKVDSKGAVKFAGSAKGKAYSGSTCLVTGDGFAFIPVVSGKNATLVRIESSGTVSVVSSSSGGMSDGGVTAKPRFDGWDASANTMVGVAYKGTPVMNGLSWPLTFTASKLPTGCKINASTGVISGIPTKTGTFLTKVTATSKSNKKWTATYVVTNRIVALPEWAKGQFTGTVDGNALTMSVGSTGKVSGKFKQGATNWTFSASSFAAASQTAAEPLALVCSATAKGTYKVKSGKKTVTKSVTAPISFTLVAAPDVSPIAAEGLGDFAGGTGNVEIQRVAGVRLSIDGVKGGTVKMDKSYGQVVSGKSVKFTATLAKGYALLGWYDAVTGARLSQATSFSLKMSGADRVVVARFAKESALAVPVLSWNAATNLTVGVSYSATPKVSGEAAVKIVSVSGLPSGLSYKSGKVTGVATTAKAYTVSVKVALATNAKKKFTLRQRLVVTALPAWAKGTYVGGWSEGEGTNQVTLTIGSTGKVSGKLNFANASWTLTGTKYTKLDPEERTATLSLTAKKGSTKKTVSVTVGADELGGFAVSATSGFAFEARQNLWKKDELWKAWAAELNERACTNEVDGLVVTFGANGTATAKLKVGKNAFSASAVLCPADIGESAVSGRLYLYFAPNTKKKFKGAVRVVEVGSEQ